MSFLAFLDYAMILLNEVINGTELKLVQHKITQACSDLHKFNIMQIFLALRVLLADSPLCSLSGKMSDCIYLL